MTPASKAERRRRMEQELRDLDVTFGYVRARRRMVREELRAIEAEPDEEGN